LNPFIFIFIFIDDRPQPVLLFDADPILQSQLLLLRKVTTRMSIIGVQLFSIFKLILCLNTWLFFL